VPSVSPSFPGQSRGGPRAARDPYVFSHQIFGTSELAGHGYYPAALAILPFVIWGALRFEHWGASLTTVLVSVLAIVGTTQGTGPFAAGSAVDSLLRWCSFVNVVAVTGVLLAATSAEQLRMLQDLQASNDELERRVRKRTSDLVSANADLQQQIAERRRLEGELIRVSEEQQKLIGRELHDGLGQHLTSVALLGAALQQKLDQRGAPDAEAAGRIVVLIDQATSMTQAIARVSTLWRWSPGAFLPHSRNWHKAPNRCSP
jgi:signal transduction histidine kinase